MHVGKEKGQEIFEEFFYDIFPGGILRWLLLVTFHIAVPPFLLRNTAETGLLLLIIADRTKGNFYHVIEKQNEIVRDHKPREEEKKTFLSSMNSYLGIMKHYNTYRLRKDMLAGRLSGWW
jgi:hypothetical protein